MKPQLLKTLVATHLAAFLVAGGAVYLYISWRDSAVISGLKGRLSGLEEQKEKMKKDLDRAVTLADQADQKHAAEKKRAEDDNRRLAELALRAESSASDARHEVLRLREERQQDAAVIVQLRESALASRAQAELARAYPGAPRFGFAPADVEWPFRANEEGTRSAALAGNEVVSLRSEAHKKDQEVAGERTAKEAAAKQAANNLGRAVSAEGAASYNRTARYRSDDLRQNAEDRADAATRLAVKESRKARWRSIEGWGKFVAGLMLGRYLVPASKR